MITACLLCFTKISSGLIQHLSQSTAVPALYLMTGSLPLKATTIQMSSPSSSTLTRRVDAVEKEVLLHQLVMADMDSHNWTTPVREMMCMYDLPSVYGIILFTCQYTKMEEPSDEECTRLLVGEVQLRPRHSLNQPPGFSISSLVLLTRSTLLKCGHDPFEVTMVATKAWMAVLRYGLYSSHCAREKEVYPVSPMW